MGCGSSQEAALPAHKRAMVARPTLSVAAAAMSAAIRGERTFFSLEQLIVSNAGKSVHDVYTIDATPIGQGAFGSVLRGTHRKTKRVAAIKVVAKHHKDEHERLMMEVSAMKALDHPNIIKLFETFEDGRASYMVMEFCAGGELLGRVVELDNLTEFDASKISRQMLSAVFHMHSRHIAHRDLKPDNVLFMSKDPIATSQLRIVDFGLSCRFTPGEAMTQCCGTVLYMAPQVVAGSYMHTCDNWSLGVICFLILSGSPPFSGKNDEDTAQHVRRGFYTMEGETWSAISDLGKDFVRRLMHVGEAERASAEQALQHGWLQESELALTRSVTQRSAPMVKNLRAFRNQNMFQKAALQIIGRHSAEDKIQELRDLFVSLDANKDGTVTMRELEQGAARLDLDLGGLGLEEIMDAADTDCNGAIDYSEFIAAAMDRQRSITKAACFAAFNVFDRDGNGKISLAELRDVLESDGLQACMGGRAEALMREVDKSGDGEVDFEEFVLMVGAGFRAADCFDAANSFRGTTPGAKSEPSHFQLDADELVDVGREGNASKVYV